MKKKNIEKIVRRLYELDHLGFQDGQDLRSIIDNLAKEFPEKQPESNNEDDEMEEFKWKNCIEGKGYYVNDTSRILDIDDIWGHEGNEAVANSESIIESNIAACKLSWIITKINKKYPNIGHENGYCLCWQYNTPSFHDTFDSSLPRLNNQIVFNILIKTNLPLIKQYFGIKE